MDSLAFKWFEKHCPLILLWEFHNFLGFSSCFLITSLASHSFQTETGTLDGGYGKLVRGLGRINRMFPSHMCIFFFKSLQICSLYSWFETCTAGSLTDLSNPSFSSEAAPSLEGLHVRVTAGQWMDGPLPRFPHSSRTSGRLDAKARQNFLSSHPVGLTSSKLVVDNIFL